jgi:hypothetical protein
MLSWWSCLGSRPTWIGPHTHSIHMQGVWNHSYAMDWLIDPLSCLYWHTCWTRFAYSWKIEWRSWATNVIMVRCGWVFKPTWHGPHIHCVIHMEGVIHHSYAMDWIINPLSCLCRLTIWPWFPNPLKSSNTACVQMLSWWSDWGSRPTWNGPHTHCIHMQGVRPHSYAIYWPMDQPYAFTTFHIYTDL